MILTQCSICALRSVQEAAMFEKVCCLLSDKVLVKFLKPVLSAPVQLHLFRKVLTQSRGLREWKDWVLCGCSVIKLQKSQPKVPKPSSARFPGQTKKKQQQLQMPRKKIERKSSPPWFCCELKTCKSKGSVDVCQGLLLDYKMARRDVPHDSDSMQPKENTEGELYLTKYVT